MTDDLVKRLRNIAVHSYLGRPVIEEAADSIEQLTAERDRLREDVEELDFLRHEGGPDSVAAIEAERDRLREALRDGRRLLAIAQEDRIRLLIQLEQCEKHHE